MMFDDRDDAGRQLAAILAKRGYASPVVLGIPRGGVPVALHVARRLGGTLGVVVARKLGAPGQQELAIGAVTADGVPWVNEGLARELGVDEAYLQRVTAEQTEEARRRERMFNGDHRPEVKGRTVVIVDDGIATGATAVAAARCMRAAGATRVVVAVPVGPMGTLATLREVADEVVVLDEEEDFWAVGQFYRDFRPVEDEEVRRVLEGYRAGAERGEAWVEHGSVRLAVSWAVPPRPLGVVIFVHGLGSSRGSPRNVVVAERLVDAGFGTVLFDLSGHGDSSRATRPGIEGYVDDLVAVFDWAVAQRWVARSWVVVAGSSLGGVVALEATKEGRVTPAALVLRAAPAEVEEYEGVSCPALLLVGTRDSLLTGARAAAAAHPSFALGTVEGASHLFEEPGTLAVDATVSWLCEVMG